MKALEAPTPTPGKHYHYHYRERFMIRTEWQGGTLLYDVFTNSGRIVATGFDLLSGDERTALEGILGRRNGTEKFGGI